MKLVRNWEWGLVFEWLNSRTTSLLRNMKEGGGGIERLGSSWVNSSISHY